MENLDYRTQLKEQFELKKKSNPRYSIRAYAQFLDLDSGTLSAVLKGKRKLPKTHWLTCSKKFKLKKSHRMAFLESLWQEQGLQAEEIHMPVESLILNPEQYFEIVSEWEYAAALCLLDIPDYAFSITSISRDLGITLKRSRSVFENLFRYGLVHYENQKAVKFDRNFETTDDVCARALQVAHLNELELAKQKLLSVGVLEREFSSMTLSCRAQDMKKMKKWMREKKAEFERMFEKKDANQVFLYAMQLFPLSQKVEK